MGSFSTKTKQKTTPIVTGPMQENLFGPTGFSNKIADFANMDPTQFVAPTSPLQNTAFANAQNLGGGQAAIADAAAQAKAAGLIPAGQATTAAYDPANLGKAAQAGAVGIDPTTNANASLADYQTILENGGIQPYMDPAIQSYVNNTLAEYDAQSGRSRAAMEAAAGGSGAFGGSRYGIQAGEFDANTDRGRALTESGLRSQAYSQAVQAAMADAQRRTSVDISNAGLGTNVSLANAGSANQRAALMGQLGQERNLYNAGAQNTFAQQQAQLAQQAAAANAAAQNQTSMFNVGQQADAANRQLQSTALQGQLATQGAGLAQQDVMTQGQLGEMQYAIDQAQRNAVPTQLQLAGSLYGAINPAAYIGSNVKGTSTPGLGAVGAGLAGAGLAGWASGGFKFSDARLKTGVTRIGSHGPLGIYAYTIFGKPEVGVMAHEVAQHAPHALGPVIGGYATVDYSKL